MPTIVTTANLFICEANYAAVDLETGEVGGAEVVPVPYLRFMKSLSAGKVNRSTGQLEDVSDQSERTVIVVQAKSFLSFLQTWDLGDLPSELAHALFN